MKPGSRLDKIVTAVCMAAGAGAVAYGLWQIYPPLAWMAGGVYLLLLALGAGLVRDKAAAKEAAAK